MKIRFPEYFQKIKALAKNVSQDKIGIYAAQASFFVIISALPFLSLLIAIFSFFIPSDTAGFLDEFTISQSTAVVLDSVLKDLENLPKLSLASISALAALWSSSKGFGAVRNGVETIYMVDSGKNFFRRKIQSLINTLVFIVLIVAAVALLLFGDFLVGLLNFPKISTLIMHFKLPFFGVAMCVIFTGMYMTMGRGSSLVRLNVLDHLPGAVFASLGWILFSAVYSLYIEYFPNASYVYGGLGAVCLIMLWLYFCMMILLFGAEFNKILITHKRNKEGTR